MSAAWVNGKILETYSKKIEKWKPEPPKEKPLWGLCVCAEPIYEGDAVGMRGDHEIVVCYVCWVAGKLEQSHLDCVGLKLPGVTLSN